MAPSVYKDLATQTDQLNHITTTYKSISLGLNMTFQSLYTLIKFYSRLDGI